MDSSVIYRIAAFTDSPHGGNPAGVWIGPELPSSESMQEIASQIGYPETVFLAPETGPVRKVRYYSPEAEVGFCGHATVAAGIVLGAEQGESRYRFVTAVGDIPLAVRDTDRGVTAELTSVEPHHKALPRELLEELLGALGWSRDFVDNSIPPAVASAGNWHPVIAVSDRSQLDKLDYDFEQLKQLMLRENWTTVQLIWRESDKIFHSRNPFPVGGIFEDPATGAAAAALGGYLRDAGLVDAPFSFRVVQGEAMGRPSHLGVSIPVAGGIRVSGTATAIEPVNQQ